MQRRFLGDDNILILAKNLLLEVEVAAIVVDVALRLEGGGGGGDGNDGGGNDDWAVVKDSWVWLLDVQN